MPNAVRLAPTFVVNILESIRISMMLPIKIHLTIMVICEFIGFLLAAVLVGSMWICGMLGGGIWLVALVALPTLLIGTLIPRFVFRKLILARCPKGRGLRGPSPAPVPIGPHRSPWPNLKAWPETAAYALG